MRTAERTNRLLDELREDFKDVLRRLERLEQAFEIAFPGRFTTPVQLRAEQRDARRRQL